MRCYSDYMHEEYGDLDSDYVFVNFWAGRIGHPLTADTVAALVRRTRNAVGFSFHAAHAPPHLCDARDARQSALGGRQPIGHARSIETTISTYLHHTVEDLREALRRPA